MTRRAKGRKVESLKNRTQRGCKTPGGKEEEMTKNTRDEGTGQRISSILQMVNGQRIILPAYGWENRGSHQR